MKWKEIESLPCPIARSLAIIGDKWTLLILRDIFLGLSRFSQIQASLKISRHRLSDRLTLLVEEQVLEKQIYDQSRNRSEYRLSTKGLELQPILLLMAQWAEKWMPDDDGALLDYRHRQCEQALKPKVVCGSCDSAIDPQDVLVQAGTGLLKKSQRGEFAAAEVEKYRRQNGKKNVSSANT